MNISQEGCDDLDDLREVLPLHVGPPCMSPLHAPAGNQSVPQAEMVNALTISSSEYTTIMAYQGLCPAWFMPSLVACSACVTVMLV